MKWSILLLLVASQLGNGQSDFLVYVSSRGENAVKLYNSFGEPQGYFVTPGAGGLALTEDILFHPDGSVLVSGFSNSAIKQYDGLTGNFIGDFTSGYTLSGPSKMSIGPDNLLYVTQWGAIQNDIARFDLDGNFVDEFTAGGIANGLGHVWDASGNLIIALYADGESGEVGKLNSMGLDIGPFANSVFLHGPTNVYFNSDSSLLVTDWTTGNVVKYDDDGSYLGNWNSGSMTSPEGIALTPNGLILIGDWGQDAIHAFDTLGNYQGYFTAGEGLTDPNSVKVQLIEDTSTTQIEAFTLSGFSINPNFGSGTFHVMNSSNHTFEYSIQNTSGNRVDYIGQRNGSFHFTPNSTIPAGKYFLIAIDNNDNLISSPFVLLR